MIVDKEYLKSLLKQIAEEDQCDCDDCDENCDAASELDDAMTDTIMEADDGSMVKNLSYVLMMLSKRTGFTNTSSAAHAIWVES